MSFTISRIGGFKFNHYDPKINEVNTKRPDVLTPEQLKTFLNMDMEKITPAYRDRKQVELYYDFCVFMFHSFFSPCDVIKLKCLDCHIQGTTDNYTILLDRTLSVLQYNHLGSEKAALNILSNNHQ
ncbi:MAG: hypothetical protein LBL79_09610 [Prevotella sp.]|nr:hypothetical protein [Prevotella sp.]